MDIKEVTTPSPTKAPLIFISAGDPSGDVHAARLVEALAQRMPQARFIGYAGPQTAATCCDVRFDLTQFAVMMLKRAILNLPNYLKLLKQADTIFREERPDVVILVDFPGFNWKIAQKAKAAGVPTVYFMPPQIWGWGQWRVKKMRRLIDLVLSCFSFENAWLTERGCNSTLVGHPFFEEARSREVDQEFIASLNSTESGVSASTPAPRAPGQKRYLTILPGSRNQEVINNLPNLLATIDKALQAVPDVQPVFAAFRDAHANDIRNELKTRGLDYPVYVGKTPELMRTATCCLGVSGSVSIELLSLCKPTVITYRISKLEHFVIRFLKRVKYITLTNLLYVYGLEGETPFYPKGYIPTQTEHTPQERELMLFPEFLTKGDCSDSAAEILIGWFTSDETRLKCVEKLEALKEIHDFVEHPIELAADKIVEFLASRLLVN